MTAEDAEPAVVPAEPPTTLRDSDPVRYVTAARELFEETGILLARTKTGDFLASSPDLESRRRELVAGSLSFTHFLNQHHLQVWEADFVPLGNVVTPPFSSLRFDTAFFVAGLPPRQQPEVWPGELEAGHWATAVKMLGRWQRAEILISPPTLMMLQAIADRHADEVPAVLAALLHPPASDPIPPIYFAPDVRLIPLHTQALPPSTHTNAYLIGKAPSYLLDPGAAAQDEQQRLFAVLDAHLENGGRLTAVVLTHQHPDHVGAAAACRARYQLPVWAHPLTARALQGKVPVDVTIADGQHLDLGTSADGHSPWHLQAIHTPGHAAGHLCFFEPHYRLLFAGDMVSTQSSVVIAPPDGDLAIYLQSLRSLRAVPARLLLPAHGGVSARPVATIDECLAHRARREEMLLSALASGLTAVPELALELYKGIPDDLMCFAQMQVRAGLRKLESEQKVTRTGDGNDATWSLSEKGAC
jgi:glyoxylase-like metal-dependent hydrolase (beta-lactamase superfamily II)/8-oxo-dGTP pyrophosphatase MutT (NUDIX family)